MNRRRRYTPIVAPPDRYFLTVAETAGALGISVHRLRERIRRWKIAGTGTPPQPVWLDRVVRFRIDDLGLFPNTWLERFRAKRAVDFGLAAQGHHA